MSNNTGALIPCDNKQCNGHGHCFLLNNVISCECRLGYDGNFCQNRVSKPIGVALTLGFLGCIIGLVALAFLFAFIKKRTKANKRKTMTTQKEVTMSESVGPL